MHIFMSYESSDRDFAKDLAARLAEAGFTVFDPEQDIAAGENASLKTGKALEASDAMIVLLSPEAMKSSSVRREIDYALGSPNFKQRLISVLVRPTEDIPWILRRLPLISAGQDRAKVSHRIIEQLQHANTN